MGAVEKGWSEEEPILQEMSKVTKVSANEEMQTYKLQKWSNNLLSGYHHKLPENDAWFLSPTKKGNKNSRRACFSMS